MALISSFPCSHRNCLERDFFLAPELLLIIGIDLEVVLIGECALILQKLFEVERIRKWALFILDA